MPQAPLYIQVRGLNELRSKLRAAGTGLAPWLRETAAEATEPVVRESRKAAPHRTGQLAGEIHSESAGVEGRAVSSLIYSGVIHGGWPGHGIEAQPFLEEGLVAADDQVVDAYEEGLGDLLARTDLI